MSNHIEQLTDEKMEFYLRLDNLDEKMILQIELEIALQCIEDMGKLDLFKEFCQDFKDFNLLDLLELFLEQHKVC